MGIFDRLFGKKEKPNDEKPDDELVGITYSSHASIIEKSENPEDKLTGMGEQKTTKENIEKKQKAKTEAKIGEQGYRYTKDILEKLYDKQDVDGLINILKSNSEEEIRESAASKIRSLFDTNIKNINKHPKYVEPLIQAFNEIVGKVHNFY